MHLRLLLGELLALKPKKIPDIPSAIEYHLILSIFVISNYFPMITEELIRKQFIHQILRRDAAFIYETQSRVLRDNLTNNRAMAFASFLASRPFSVSGAGLNITYAFSIFPYLRFLDIKFSRENMGLRRRLALYNRVIWGRLYHQTLSDLRYGLTQDMKDSISAKLRALNPGSL